MIDQEKLYESVKNREISAPLDIVRMTKDRITNPTELLFDTEKNRMVNCFTSPSTPYQSLSDYERFSLFVSNLPYMVGSGARELFSMEMSLLFGYDKRISKNDAEALWTISCETIERAGFSASTLLEKCGIRQSDQIGVFDVKLVRSYAKCYLDFIDEIAYNVSKNATQAVWFNASALSFVKTDIYHCDEAYKRFAACRDYNKYDEDLLVCGMLYSVCDILKKENRPLWLYVGDNLSEVDRLLRYLSDRGVLPQVYAVLSEASARKGAAVISRIPCVSPAFVYEMGDTSDAIAKKLLSFASVYPISLVRYGGIFGAVAIPKAAHNLVKLGVCKALSELCDDLESANEILEAILSIN